MQTPIEVVVDQDTAKWHDFRALGIGSSDASVLAGTNNWKTVIELWEEKTGKSVPSFEENAATLHGKNLEPTAREAFEKSSGIAVNPRCFIHPEYDFIRASLDGINDELDLVLEIKCPYNFTVHRKFMKTGKIPTYYYSQIQHQLLVTGAVMACYWSYTENTGGVIAYVSPEQAYIDELLEREIKFWNLVQSDTEPIPSEFAMIMSESESV